MRKLLTFGDEKYNKNVKLKLVPFITSRLAPFVSFTLIIILISKLNYPELGKFSYLTAMYSLPVVLMSMPLAMIGNISVEEKKNGKSGFDIFLSGLPIAISMSLLGFLSAIIMKENIINKENASVLIASRVYIFCVPLLIANTYLFYFIEGFVSNIAMARIKLITTLISSFSIISISFYVQKLLTWHVFSVFLFIEIIIFILYIYVLYENFDIKNIKYKIKDIKFISSKILRIGLPVALGLAGQKAVYFLITQRLTNFNIDLISDLSIMMSIIGIISLPFGAFSQIHSLFVSENEQKEHKKFFINGVKLAVPFIILMILITWLTYPYLIRCYGANPQLLGNAYFISLCFLFATSSFMLLCMSHLRALQDTFYSQATAVIILLLGFIPVVWLYRFQNGELYKIIYIQSMFTALIILILIYRIVYFTERKQKGISS
ncbi:hypothetical protein PEC311524_26910 [Pectobacterium carotovorum subsp. carotovorum]|nr:hypothetical protein PEC311524_26910 [Pectobacterium carotovorum subsp. carotovorum]